MGVRQFERQMMTAAGEPVAIDERVYHMVPTSVYDQVMQEGLKPMVGEATGRFHPEAKPFIHAMSDPSHLGLYTPWVYEQHGPFHVVSVPAHYFKTVHPSSDPIVPADRQYEGTGAEPGTLVSDQNIPPHELRHEHSWDSPFVQQELMDQWYEDNGGRPRTASMSGLKESWDPGEQAHFQYDCWQDHNSQDANLWYRSHQPVTVLGHEEGYGPESHSTPMHQRLKDAMPIYYRVRFPDGLEHTAREDELVTDPSYLSDSFAPPPIDQIEQHDPEYAQWLRSPAPRA